jgi:hypothetical protein
MDVNVNKTLMAALLLGLVSQAQAVDITTNIGLLPTEPTTFNGTITHLGSTSFTDTFNFSMPSSGLSALVADFEISFGPNALYDINSITAVLYNGSNGSGSWISNLAGSGTNTVNDSFGLVAGNSYSILVSGTPIGSAGGIYAYAFTAAVPEAETYAMMLAGLGLLGFMVRRRTSQRI